MKEWVAWTAEDAKRVSAGKDGPKASAIICDSVSLRLMIKQREGKNQFQKTTTEKTTYNDITASMAVREGASKIRKGELHAVAYVVDELSNGKMVKNKFTPAERAVGHHP